MNKFKPLISIIVPVYKVEKFLPYCIESLLNQTYKDINIILVDDGSPDNCPAMCDEYAAIDARIHVIHQKNAGLSGARTAGLEYVEKSHTDDEDVLVSFIDSDDWLAPDTIESCIHLIDEYKADVIQY